jgi:hypothetical protein
MSFPNTAPIRGTEKGWGLVVALLVFPMGLVVLLGLLADQAWGRWVGLVLGVLAVIGGVVAVVAVLAVLDWTSYPFAPWFAFLAGAYGVLGFLAARAFWHGLRSTDTE